MLEKTTIDKGKIYQTAFASLFEIEIDDVPEFDKYNKALMWEKFMFYVNYLGYKFQGCLYNANWVGGNSDLITSLKFQRGIKGYFLALVTSPEDKEKNHIVIINKMFDIVNVVYDKYIGIIGFPKHKEMGYNGIKQILLVNEDF